MAEVITMLALSPTMEEGTIAAWLKAEGESVEEGEIIAEIETDKATMEMESFFEGTVLKVLVKSGDTVPVGAPMAVIGEAGEDPQEALDEHMGDELYARIRESFNASLKKSSKWTSVSDDAYRQQRDRVLG